MGIHGTFSSSTEIAYRKATRKYEKVFPRYEIKETSYLGVIMVAAIIRVNELLG